MTEKIVDMKAMVKFYLELHDYDGLFNYDNECCCKLDDLMPCHGNDLAGGLYCEAGYLHTCDCGQGCDFHIGRKKPEVGDGG